MSFPSFRLHTHSGILFRIFLALTILALAGIIWRFNKGLSVTIKSPGGSFTEGIIGAPRFINPVLAQSQSDKDMTKLIFSPLLRIDKEGKVTYILADHIDVSSDAKSYTVELKAGRYFHDKEAITADDLIFTINKIQDPLIKSPLLGRWQGVSVKKLDDMTVQFNLARPYSDFLYNLELGVLPQHIWENINEQEFIFSTYNTNPVGSGPFVITDSSQKDNGVTRSYELKSSDAFLRHLTIIFFDNEEDMVTAYKKGDINAMYGFSKQSSLESIRKRDQLMIGTLPRTFGIFLNQGQQSIFQDLRIRQALFYGVNKEQIINDVFSGLASASDNPLGNPETSNHYNPEKAKELIEAAGWRLNDEGIYSKTIKGETQILSFNLSILNTEEMQTLADMIAVQLRDIGIVMGVRSFDQGNLSQNVIRPREYDALLFGYELEKPSDLYAFWHSSQRNDPGLNISLYANSTVDKELNLLRSDADAAQMENILKEIEKDIPAIFLYAPRFSYVLPRNIRMDEALEHLKNASDRYADISNWYTRTRQVWKFLVH